MPDPLVVKGEAKKEEQYMGDRKQPSPPPGDPGYTGPPNQVKPQPPPAPPRRFKGEAEKDDLRGRLEFYIAECDRQSDIIDRLQGEAEGRSRAVPSEHGCTCEDRYNELLLAVVQKFPGESRHETALRYIREREQQPGSGPVMALTPPTDTAPSSGDPHHESGSRRCLSRARPGSGRARLGASAARFAPGVPTAASRSTAICG